MPTNARRRHPIDTGGPWGTGLLLFGIGATVQGLGYLGRGSSRIPPALATFGDTVPIQWWALLWVAAGLFCGYKALNPPQRHADVWPLVGMTVLWACVYLIDWIVKVVQDGDWLAQSGSSAVAWAMLASVLVCWGRCVNPPRIR